MRESDFRIEPQVTEPKFGPEPSLKALIYSYYEQTGMEHTKAQKCRDDYISRLICAGHGATTLERDLAEAVRLLEDIQDELQQSNDGKGPTLALNVHILVIVSAFLTSLKGKEGL